MIIRKMNENDLEDVAAIEAVTFSMPWSKQGFADALRVPDTIFLVAVDEETQKVAGYIGMYVSFEEGEITNVAVASDAREKGIGSLLVECAIEKAKESGVKRIILEVRVSNAHAIHVYMRQGFVRVGTRRDFYEMPKEDADIMVWEREEEC